MTATAAEVNAAFAAIFNNGRGEVGLEVGVDPGLAQNEYIRIPRSMAKAWAAKILDNEANRALYAANIAALAPGVPVGSAANSAIPDFPGTAEGCASLFGWITQGLLYVNQGKTFAKIGNAKIFVHEFHTRAPTNDDAMRFYTVNQGHINDAAIDEAHHNWIHAVRFWGVVAGTVTTSKSDEFVIVDDPTTLANGATEFAAFAPKYAPNAYTAGAARAGTWRKTNHCTGGSVVAGFAKRWLEKEGYRSRAVEKAERDRANKVATDAFYVAAHAISPHAVLAFMAPEDEGHWALVDPNFGYIMDWSVKPSVSMRLSPKTQIAGGAMVADSFVVLGMLVVEGLAPLLNHSGQAMALKAQYDFLSTNGVTCATYAGWFLDGHPDGLAKQEFSQKDTRAADLIGELGYVATKYYEGSTIGESPALASAAAQLGSHVAKDSWSSLATKKKSMTADQIAEAYAAIKGGSTTGRIANILSDDIDAVRAAVVALNQETTTLAAIVGVDNPQLVSDAAVLTNRGLVDKKGKTPSQ